MRWLFLRESCSGRELRSFGERILSDTTMTQATIYFKYYVNRALVEAGLGNDYLNWLGIWKENLDYGMTTWGETSDLNYTRSDCHGWGSSPNIEFYPDGARDRQRRSRFQQGQD